MLQEIPAQRNLPLVVTVSVLITWPPRANVRKTFLTFKRERPCFTVVMRQAKLDLLHVAALVSTGSLVIYLPIYLALYGTRLARLPLAEITVQAIFQGVLVTIVSLLLCSACHSNPFEGGQSSTRKGKP